MPIVPVPDKSPEIFKVFGEAAPKESDPIIEAFPTMATVLDATPKSKTTPLFTVNELLTVKGRLAVLMLLPPAVKS
jgi:hypothetical protein